MENLDANQQFTDKQRSKIYTKIHITKGLILAFLKFHWENPNTHWKEAKHKNSTAAV